MTHLDKLWQTNMLTALNTKEAHSKQKCDKHNDIPKFKIGDLIMIKNFDKKLTWDAKYVPNFKVVKLIGTKQLEVSDPTSRLRKVNISDVHNSFPLVNWVVPLFFTYLGMVWDTHSKALSFVNPWIVAFLILVLGSFSAIAQ